MKDIFFQLNLDINIVLNYIFLFERKIYYFSNSDPDQNLLIHRLYIGLPLITFISRSEDNSCVVGIKFGALRFDEQDVLRDSMTIVGFIFFVIRVATFLYFNFYHLIWKPECSSHVRIAADSSYIVRVFKITMERSI
jgi:hypothetical protein